MKRSSIEYKPREAPISVLLDFPLLVDGAELAAVDLWPPALDAVARLSHPLDPVALVVAVSGLPPRVAKALRWSDAEAILTAAAVVLPPDLAGLPSPESDVAPVQIEGEANPEPLTFTDPDDETLPAANAAEMVDFVRSPHRSGDEPVDMADFVTSFRL